MKRNTIYAAAISLSVLAAASGPALAGDDEDLRQEVRELKARVAELEAREAARDKQAQVKTISATRLTAITPAAGSPAPIAPAAAPAGSVEQRLETVEAAQSAAPKIDVGFGKGLTVSSPDRQYSLTVRAYAQIDNREFFSGRSAGSDTFLVRTARPIVEGKMTDYFNGRLMWDFGQGNARLLDGYADFHPLAHLTASGGGDFSLRAGEFKLPVGLERWQSEQDLAFVERGQTTNLVPQRDLGLMAWGRPWNGLVEYEVGLVNGASDLQINTGDTDNAKDTVGRVLARPFASTDMAALEGLALGAGGTYGQHRGTAASPGLTSGYLTAAQRSWFSYTPAAGTPIANGADWRFNPQLQYTVGGLAAQGEYVREGQDIANGLVTRELVNDAWMASASYLLTGEKASFDGIRPLRDFDPASGNWGAFEIAARLSRLDIDADTFPTFADPTKQARRANEWVVGGNWYFNPAVKLNLDYARMSFAGGAPGGASRPPEETLLTRTQFRF